MLNWQQLQHDVENHKKLFLHFPPFLRQKQKMGYNYLLTMEVNEANK